MADTISLVPRRRLRDLVTPQDEHGNPDPKGNFLQPGASSISREDGNRLIAVKFSVRGRDLASTVAEAQAKTASLLKPPYRSVWSGEFQQMQEAEHRMLIVVVALVGVDHGHALSGVQIAARRPGDLCQCGRDVAGRDLDAAGDRPALQYFGRRGLYLDSGRGCDERLADGFGVQSAALHRRAAARGDRQRHSTINSTGDDDRARPRFLDCCPPRSRRGLARNRNVRWRLSWSAAC